MALRRFFCSRRLRRCPGGTEVFTRGFGLASDRRISSASLARAMTRFRAWLRVSETWITIAPSCVQRRPAMCLSRRFADSGREGERPASKRNSTAVATLFTFCPPGPEARTNCSVISQSPSSMSGVIHIVSARFDDSGCSGGTMVTGMRLFRKREGPPTRRPFRVSWRWAS